MHTKNKLLLNNLRRKFIVKSINNLNQNFVEISLESSSDFTAPKPGQYLMVMCRNSEEIPLSVFKCENKKLSLLIKKVGYSTSEFFKLKIGDYVLVRGPYGNFFETLNHENILMVAGGSGLAPLYFLACERKKGNLEQDILLGFRNLNETVKLSNFNNTSCFNKVVYYTDDGSYGKKGFPTDDLLTYLKRGSYSLVVAAGPEKMLQKIFQTCLKEGIDALFSLERYIKCSLGLCGSCILEGRNKSYRVCVDGPVFSITQLKDVVDFGKFKYDETGRKINI